MMSWWPSFDVVAVVLLQGLPKIERFTVRAPSLWRAEEFANYRYESWTIDFEIVSLEFSAP